MASPNLSELVTTTLRDRQGELADNVSKSNALLSRLNEAGQIDLVDGGRTSSVSWSTQRTRRSCTTVATKP